MKTSGILVLIVVCSISKAEVPAIPQISVRELHQSFAYTEPKATERGAADAPASSPTFSDSHEEILKMEPFVVTDLIARQDLEKAIRDQAAAEGQKNFSWKRGGLLMSKKLGGVNADLGLWPSLETRRIGSPGNNDILLRVELLRLRW